MLSIQNVSKRLPNGFSIRDMSFQVNPGEVAVLLGPNGAGKTTLIRLVVGIYKPDCGGITVNGFSVSKDREIASFCLGVVTDRLHQYPWLSCTEYLEFCAGLYNLSKTDWTDDALKMIERFEMTRHMEKTIKELSSGMRQKLNFVRATLHKPPILLLDEPTLGLDPIAVELLVDHVRDHAARGGSVLVCTHDLRFSVMVGTKFIFLRSGRTVKEIDRGECLEQYLIDFETDGDSARMLDQLQALGGRVSSRPDGSRQLVYEENRHSSKHQGIVCALRDNQARVLGLHSDPTSHLETLYRQVTAEMRDDP